MNSKVCSSILLLTIAIALCELSVTPAKQRGSSTAGTTKIETPMTNMISQRICTDKYGNQYPCP
ncbi:MAG: hypothetical protein MUE44_30980 [Oscillatoriaceae cyanobacterium Prado104]|nr:hypothetical protein [Oscillatoriaceae cyanobacterium Prado104]